MTQEWTVPAVERTEPDRTTGERQALEGWLDYHRATFVSKCAGLTAPQLCLRASPPSGLSLLGLVRHLTDVERQWFRLHAAGEDLPYVYFTEDGNPDCDFEEGDESSAAADVARYLAEVEAARAAVASKDLDDVVPSRGHHPEWVRNIRWIFLHMLEEYARHNGHADLLREAIDGATGD